MVTDGLNNAVPAHKEMQSSISWLINKKLVEKAGNRYQLSESGKYLYDSGADNIKKLIDIFSGLEKNFNLKLSANGNMIFRLLFIMNDKYEHNF